MPRIRTLFVLTVLALVCTAIAYSQAVNATLLGTVTDASGAVVANAKVAVTEANTGVSHSSVTNSSGNYTFPDQMCIRDRVTTRSISVPWPPFPIAP